MLEIIGLMMAAYCFTRLLIESFKELGERPRFGIVVLGLFGAMLVLTLALALVAKQGHVDRAIQGFTTER